jgi:DNA (cytosine-5)-methyltransferase 1
VGPPLSLNNAGFQHRALIEIDKHAVQTLTHNIAGNPEWEGCQILAKDLTEYSAEMLLKDAGLAPGELDLLSGGVPCPPFSAAGKQLGQDDERDLFPVMLTYVEVLQPQAVMIENVRGLLEPAHKFKDYRDYIEERLREAGYRRCMWEVLEARDFGVPQLRPRAILVYMRPEYADQFDAAPLLRPRGHLKTVGEVLKVSMRQRFRQAGHPDWKQHFKSWLAEAEKGIAPTLVGGSKKHGGADLGPTRAKREWRKLGVDAMGVANHPGEMVDRERDLYGKAKDGTPIGPKLTVAQAALIQGFPEEWVFTGRKTAAYRQVGNAFPPPVAQAVGQQIREALEKGPQRPVDEPQVVLDSALFPRPAASPRSEPADSRCDLEGAGAR